MRVVVDASAIAAVAFGESEGPTIAAHIRRQTLLAPTLIDYELASIAVKKARRQPNAAVGVGIALAAALRLPIQRVPVPAAEAFVVAVRRDLTAYDAAYLWLAESHDLELVTLDEGLQRENARREQD